MGIFAGSGVGKSVLLGMMTRFTEADIVVVGLIGERAREVASFAAEVLNGKSRDRTVIVAEPADRSPLLRIRGANRATAIAEYFRSKGKNVLPELHLSFPGSCFPCSTVWNIDKISEK